MTITISTPLDARFVDIAEVVHIFFPDAKVTPGAPDACDITHTHTEAEGWAEDVFTWGDDTFRWTTRICGDKWEKKRRLKRGIKQCCYYLIRSRTGIAPPWGSLTGIRPTRLFYERMARGNTMKDARVAVVSLFDLRTDRARLLESTVLAQRGLIDSPENAVDIYVGIPFCTTRCSYCSFFAEAVGKGKKVPPYLAALLEELAGTAEIAMEAGLAPRALYVGGGTPTALAPEQLAAVLTAMRRHFPQAAEFTVEAGRPDTITKEKLAVMAQAGVTRISINPQTMRDETLAIIGRGHSAAETREAYALARSMGFANINMDLIAALPGETTADFAETLRAIEALGPESLTVHTLARKHGSVLNEFGFAPTSGDVAEEMVGMGGVLARAMGMRPYYLYRQKYVAGNLENVGYARPGYESLYNIDIMEETTNILAVGAGAISKRIFRSETRIERAPNVGDVGHYIARAPEMVTRKRKLWGLCE